MRIVYQSISTGHGVGQPQGMARPGRKNPVLMFFEFPGVPLLLPDIQRAQGARIFDSQGKSYLDLEAGIWCTVLGHGHPEWLKAIQDQAALIGHAGYVYSHPVVRRAAQRVLELTGFQGGRCQLLCSGSEAVEYSLRVAAEVMNRPLLLTMADSYFGAYGAAAEMAADKWWLFDWAECEQCRRESCGPGCPRWAEIPFARVGALVFEPGSSHGLVRFPPKKLLLALAREVQGQGGLVVVNEVTTGLGRTGEWFGYQHYGLEPDLVAMGKALGNGYPVSAAAVSPAVVEKLGQRQVAYAQSHQNDPLGAAVALAVLDCLRGEDLIERARETGAWLLEKLGDIASASGRVKEIRARGLMIAVELNDGPGVEFTSRVFQSLLQAGYIVAQRPGLPVLRIDPPLNIEVELLEGFLAAFEECLAA